MTSESLKNDVEPVLENPDKENNVPDSNPKENEQISDADADDYENGAIAENPDGSLRVITILLWKNLPQVLIYYKSMYDACQNTPLNDDEYKKAVIGFSNQAFVHRPLSLQEWESGISEEDIMQKYMKMLIETTKGTQEIFRSTILSKEDLNVMKREALKKASLKIENMKMLFWDLGGKTIAYLSDRTYALSAILEREKFDIICLQEVNPIIGQLLKFKFGKTYEIIPGRVRPDDEFSDIIYTLLRRESITHVGSKTIYYTTTGEMRCLLKTQTKIGETKLCILNTHLESMKENSVIRRKQLQKCFNIFQAIESGSNVIFGGSLNVRNWEYRHIQLPKDLDKIDLWTALGAKKTNEFSWDLRINYTIQFPDPENSRVRIKNQPFKRFSRIYFRPAKNEMQMSPISYELIGKEPVTSNEYWISDHFGIVTEFNISPQSYFNTKDVDVKLLEKKEKGYKINRVDLLEGEDAEAEQQEVKDNWDDED